MSRQLRQERYLLFQQMFAQWPKREVSAKAAEAPPFMAVRAGAVVG